MVAAAPQPGSIRAYFSHSYHKADKQRNQFFWRLFAESGCYFTVDPKPERPTPMVISYLEWLMRRSACFVAVVPRRDEAPFNCSRYQVFENELAIRVNKPRLVFVEDGLSARLFRGSEDEVCFFHPTRFAERQKEFEERVARLVKRAAAGGSAPAQPLRDVAIVLNRDTPGAYTPAVVSGLARAVTESRLPYGGAIDPFERFGTVAQFVLGMAQYEAIVTEIRPPYMSPDILAALQDRCIPIIPICHLKPSESIEEAGAAMHLPLAMREVHWEPAGRGRWPVTFSGMQLDPGMAPVIFWRDEEELFAEVGRRLGKINDSITNTPEELTTTEKAMQYFLRAGRKDDYVFISHASSSNATATALSKELEDQGIERFHYMDPNAIPIGNPDWLQNVLDAIDRSAVFIILLDQEYVKSKRCLAELHHALSKFEEGRTAILPYVLEDMEWPDRELGRIEGRYLTRVDPGEWVPTIMGEVIDFLESDKDHTKPLPSGLEEDESLAFSEAQLEVEATNEMRIIYDHSMGKIGTFSGIDGTRLMNVETEPTALRTNLIDRLSSAAGASRTWPASVDDIGEELYQEIMARNGRIAEAYQALCIESGYQLRLVRFCFATDQRGLALPFEWMLNGSHGQPIANLHPIRRFITGSVTPRLPLSQLRRSSQRALLIAADTGGIPEVDREIDEIAALLEEAGLPKSNIQLVHSDDAVYGEVKELITQGGFHMLHIASHGEAGGEQEPFLAVPLRRGDQEATAHITASTLRDWVRGSQVRFAYLSTCLGGASGNNGSERRSQLRFSPIQNLMGALVEARVPEVVGFHWPIADGESRPMARTFYRYFSRYGDAAVALFEARRAHASQGAQIWAAPMLIQQY